MFDQIESLLRDQRNEEALCECTKLVQSQPTNARAQGYLGLCYFRQGDFKSAVEPLRRAVTLDPDFLDAGLKLAQAYDRLQMYHEACLVARDFITRHPNEHKFQGILNAFGDRYEHLDKEGWEKGGPLFHHEIILTHRD